jgi:starvation-inducible DNA-binding protein
MNLDALKKAFATHFHLYLKAHGFHVNVVGNDFTEYHQLFDMIYSDLQGSIDSFAEHIRALDGVVPMALSRITELSDIKDQLSLLDPQKMTKELLDDLTLLNTKLADVYDAANKERAYGLQNYLADRMDIQAKFMWQLRSTLK